MFSFFSHTKKGSRSIILDVQSGLVRGALVVENEDKTIRILSVVTKSIPSTTHIVNSTHLTKRILKLVEEVVEHLVSDSGRHHIESIHYILSSPWITSELKIVKIDYKKDTEITSKMLADIIKSELKQQADQDVQPIEQKVFEIKLNGYPTAVFESKKAHTLEVSLATSLSSKTFLDKLNSSANGIAMVHDHTYNSALLMQFAALRAMLIDKHEYIYIHVHSELTDIVIVKNSLCRHIASFPFGIATFLRKLTDSTKQSIESSDSLISLYQGDKLNETEKASTQKIIDPLLHEWCDLCVKSLTSSFDVTSIPRTVYLSAHSHFDLFKEALLFQNELSLSIIPYDSISTDNTVTFEAGSAQSTMMKMYTLALKTVL